MSEISGAMVGFGAARGIATATVTAVHGSRVDVRGASFGVVSARLAVAGAYSPRAGDTVIVAAADDGHYVIGVVRALREVSSTESSITAKDGSSASFEEGPEGVVWRVHDAEGRVVVEHRGGRSVVSAPEGLELCTGGDLRLSAGGQVRIESGEAVVASANGPVELCSRVADGEASARLRLDGDRVRLAASLLQLGAERADVQVDEANVVARTVRTVAHRIWEKAEVVERASGRVIEKAREVFREVEGLSQTKAGRLRLVADTALSLLATHAQVRGREKVKIDGEKIHLG